MNKFITYTTLMLISVITEIYPQSSKYGSDSIQCLGSLSVMSEFAKMELYDEAYDSWKYCFKNCPAASRNIYIIGDNILKYRIENTDQVKIKDNYIDTLMLLYDRRIKLFGQEGFVLGRKGLALLKYRPAELKTIYELLNKSFSIEKENTEAVVLGNLMQVTAKMYQNNNITASEVMDKYFLIIELLAWNQSIPPEQYYSIVESINNILIESRAAGCDTLEKYLSPRLQEHSHQVKLLRSIVSLVNKTNCTGSDFAITITEMLFNAEPSAEMAIYIANNFLAIKNYTRANDYYHQAVNLENDSTTIASIYCQMSLVSQQQNDLVTARDLALKALEIKPDMGEAYIAIGLAYAAASGNSCGENSFESAAVYWAAVDKFIEAKNIDLSVSAKADELINKYTPFFPDNKTAFFYGYQDGNDYTVGCWINETTEVRTRKLQ